MTYTDDYQDTLQQIQLRHTSTTNTTTRERVIVSYFIHPSLALTSRIEWDTCIIVVVFDPFLKLAIKLLVDVIISNLRLKETLEFGQGSDTGDDDGGGDDMEVSMLVIDVLELLACVYGW